MDIASIKNMKINERLKIMEDIWESLLFEDAEIETPSWHSDILKHRKDMVADGSASFIPVNKLKK